MSDKTPYIEILAKNNKTGLENRKMLKDALCINIMSSPGAGKTLLLTQTLKSMAKKFKFGIVEGDVATSNDAEKLKKYINSNSVYQIKTENYGGGCHLDAKMVSNAFRKIGLPKKKYDFVIIENVGNLICPADFFLGEHKRVILLSVAEGDDKPLKYPVIFKSADCVVISKIDLLKNTDFNLKNAKENIRRINPSVSILTVSALSAKGCKEWFDFLESLKN